ncbi:cell filamentation protein Fic [Aquipuribacter sp. MA13-6]|uniref:cell filamentation protein Fic n=1 Tax=unclassified Aquipuribacter TaxID=2635084 RepID=UPI003EEFCE67
MPAPADPLAALSSRPAVVAAVEQAREACGALRWHPALRRRTAEVRTEACVRAAAASAEVEGVRLPLGQVRAMVGPATAGGPAVREVGSAVGAGAAAAAGVGSPARDAVDAVVRGSLRATLDTYDLARGLSRAPAQVLARLHTLAAADLVRLRAGAGPGAGPDSTSDTLGRPRPDAAGRVDALVRLLTTDATKAPGLVLAAVADAECTTTDAFLPGAGVVARALARTVVVATGLDPSGVTVPERFALLDAPGRLEALSGWSSGTVEGVEAWVLWWGRAVVVGADHGRQVADEVLAGRLA